MAVCSNCGAELKPDKEFCINCGINIKEFCSNCGISINGPTSVEEQLDLGYKFFLGEGVPLNQEKAVLWYTKAAEKGSGVAQGLLGICYLFGYGVLKDEKKSGYWFTKAAEQGITNALKIFNKFIQKIGSNQNNAK